MSKKRVVVQGGGMNLYQVSEYDGWFYCYRIESGLLFSSSRDIGKARSMKDALDLIRSDSGQQIREISDW